MPRSARQVAGAWRRRACARRAGTVRRRQRRLGGVSGAPFAPCRAAGPGPVPRLPRRRSDQAPRPQRPGPRRHLRRTLSPARRQAYAGWPPSSRPALPSLGKLTQFKAANQAGGRARSSLALAPSVPTDTATGGRVRARRNLGPCSCSRVRTFFSSQLRSHGTRKVTLCLVVPPPTGHDCSVRIFVRERAAVLVLHKDIGRNESDRLLQVAILEISFAGGGGGDGGRQGIRWRRRTGGSGYEVCALRLARLRARRGDESCGAISAP